MESFYEAFINCEHTVLGKRLKPFSLRHCLYLEAINSPIMKIVAGDEVEISRKDLELAVIICSCDSDIIEAMNKPHILMRFHRFKRGLTGFLSYLSDYLSLPAMWNKSDDNAILNAPWILSKATLLLSKTNLSLAEIWNLPIGELLWYCASFVEQEGFGQIQSDEEQKIIAEAERLRNGK